MIISKINTEIETFCIDSDFRQSYPLIVFWGRGYDLDTQPCLFVPLFCQFIQKAQVPFLFGKGFDCFNYLVLFLLLFSLYYSICSLLDIVINIFNLGQFANTLAKRKYQENENKKNITVKKKSFFEKIIDCLFTKKTHD